MKNLFRTLAIAAVAAIALVSCNPEPNPTPDPDPTPGPAESFVKLSSAAKLEAEAAGATLSITFSTNAAWAASSSADWATIDPAKGEASEKAQTITVTVAANAVEEPRSAKITITADKAKVEVEVAQAAAAPAPDGKIRTAAELVDALGAASTAETVITLGSDIDLKDVTLAQVAVFNGTIDGGGFALKNLKATSAIIGELAAGATVKNLVIDSSCEFTPALSSSAPAAAALVLVNKGTVESVVNKASVSYDGAAVADKVAASVAGIVCLNAGGVVKGCTNEGAVSVRFTDAATAQLNVAGVVGSIEGEFSSFENNRNSGAITVEYADIPKNCCAAGVLGATSATAIKSAPAVNYGVVKDCHNTGKVSVKNGKNQNGSYSDVAGVAGYVEGTIEGCTNSGEIALDGSEDISNNTTRNCLAGVAAVSVFGAKGCSNSGKVVGTTGAMAAGTAGNALCGSNHNPCVAGVVCNVGTHYIDQSGLVASEEVVEDCHNTGEIFCSWNMKAGGGTHLYVGGVLGCNTGITKGCTNKGPVTCKAGHKILKMGGVIAAPLGTVENCSNEGAVLYDPEGKHALDGAFASQCYIGGVAGYLPIADTEIKACDNKGTVTFKNGWNETALSYVGGVVGQYGKSNCIFTGLTNKGAILVDSPSAVIVGGIIACANKAMVDCINEADITLKRVTASASGKESTVGGIVSYINTADPEMPSLRGCKNTGKITIENPAVKDGWNVYASSLVGEVATNLDLNLTIVGCTAAGEIVNANGKSGAILGHWRYVEDSADKIGTVVFGSAAEPVVVKNTVKINGAAVTKDSLCGQKYGHNLVTDNVTIE